MGLSLGWTEVAVITCPGLQPGPNSIRPGIGQQVGFAEVQSLRECVRNAAHTATDAMGHKPPHALQRAVSFIAITSRRGVDACPTCDSAKGRQQAFRCRQIRRFETLYELLEYGFKKRSGAAGLAAI